MHTFRLPLLLPIAPLLFSACADKPDCNDFPKRVSVLNTARYAASHILREFHPPPATSDKIKACYRSGDYPERFGLLKYGFARRKPDGSLFLVYTPNNTTDFHMVYETDLQGHVRKSYGYHPGSLN